MKIVAQLRLLPSPDQAELLLQTLETANQVCNVISEAAWESKVFNRYCLQKLVYRDLKDSTGLSAQLLIRLIAKVSDAYRIDKKVKREFRETGAVAYDSRILKFYPDKRMVSIWVLGFGRILVPFTGGPRQLRFLQHQAGETDLVFRKGKWFLMTCCEVLEPEIKEPSGFIGLDLGVENIVVHSDGKRVSSRVIEDTRVWYHGRRQVLQSIGTKSAKRRLKKLSGRQRRFQRDVNHRISKELVLEAKHTNRGIILEDLTGINLNAGTRATKANRDQRMNWSFFQLRSFITYKACGAGVLVLLVDPHYTSQRCNRCGHTERGNRETQSRFKCLACGFEVHADLNASWNIRDLGSLVYESKGQCQLSYGSDGNISYKPLALAGGS